jgi:large repetitive protein
MTDPDPVTPKFRQSLFYATKTTTDETSGSSQVPATSVSSQRYDQGIDPSYGIVTSKTVDPSGLALTTATAPEPATPGSLLRQVSRTLPAYAATPTTGNSITYSYYAAGATASNVSTPCLGATAIDQAQRKRFTQSPNPAAGAAISMELVYDMLGRVVGSRYVGESVWECTTYDTRGRIMTLTVPAFGTSPARTKTSAYMVGGDPSVSTVLDNSVTGSTNTSTVTTKTDFLGRVIEVTDVWGIKTITVFDVAGRVTSSSSPGGTVTSTYDNASQLVTQSIDGQVVASLTYNPVTDPLDGGSLRGISYPTGGGNGTSLAPITRDVLGRTTSLDWRQANGTPLTKDTVTRALSGRVLTDTIDVNATPAWSYSYDAAGRLTAANGSGHAYNYGYGTQAACNGTTGSQTNAGANANRTSVTDNGSQVSYGCYDQADRLLTSNTTTSTPGGMSLAVGYTAAGAGIALRKTGTPLVPITPVAGQGISFWAYGAPGGNTVDVQTLTTADIYSPAKRITVPAGVWTQFFVSWADLGNPTNMYRLHFANTVAGAQSTFYIDDIQLTGTTPTVLYSDSVAAGWEDLAWSTTFSKTNTTPAHGQLEQIWSYPNIHGDIQATSNQNGALIAGPMVYDPNGAQVAGTVLDNMIGNMDYGWLGQKQRPYEHETGVSPVIEMGARVYNPIIGRFLQVDPVEGGTSNDYAYVDDPINQFDLNGLCNAHSGGWLQQRVCNVRNVTGGVARNTGHAARWVFRHTDVSVGGCVVTCAGIGMQGGTVYWQQGVGCCFGGLSLNLARRKYGQRACAAVVGGGRLGPAAVDGSYGLYKGRRPGGDIAAGWAPGLGAGGGYVNNVDILGKRYCRHLGD